MSATTTPGRFAPPWSVEERPAIVSDANGKALAYVYFEEEPGWPYCAATTLPARD